MRGNSTASDTTVFWRDMTVFVTGDTGPVGALLEACRRSPTVQQIVVASSDKAYGEQELLPYRESSPVFGRHPYDVSKSCADLVASGPLSGRTDASHATTSVWRMARVRTCCWPSSWRRDLHSPARCSTSPMSIR
jgi:hypothetical protein